MRYQLDYAKVIEIFGGLSIKHPSVIAAGAQLISIFNKNQAEGQQINDQYVAAAASASGTLDQFGIVLELMKQHPHASAVLIQVLGILQPHIPELQQTLGELQTAANQAVTQTQ